MYKEISDVLEYLYKRGEKDLARVVLNEIKKQPKIITEPCYRQHAPIQPPVQPWAPAVPPWKTWC
jgi:hypothetical protein